MLEFMEYIQQDFSAASHWDRDNSYGALTATARALLDFPTPNGLTINLSSLASPNLATSYSLANAGAVDGSLSYLYSSLPLHTASKSNEISLRRIIPGYRQLREFRQPDEPWWWEVWHGGKRIDRRNTLIYGRMYLPASHLEALYLRRLSPTSQLKISCVSSSQLKSGGSILFLLSRDYGKYSNEWLYSTDSALLGVRGLYNFGPDPRHGTLPPSSPTTTSSSTNTIAEPTKASTAPEQVAGLNGRFSAGAEVYYGILNKSGGASAGIRFATLPRHTSFPYTMTLTLNPLMGNLSSTYAVRAGGALALCSRFDFNFYSYESSFQLGIELWRRKRNNYGFGDGSLEWARDKLRQPGKGGWGEPVEGWRLQEKLVGDRMQERAVDIPIESGHGLREGSDVVTKNDEDKLRGFNNEETAGVLKARLNHDGAVGLLWEGKVKDLLCSCGVTIDFKRREQIFRGVGLEIRYSS